MNQHIHRRLLMRSRFGGIICNGGKSDDTFKTLLETLGMSHSRKLAFVMFRVINENRVTTG